MTVCKNKSAFIIFWSCEHREEQRCGVTVQQQSFWYWYFAIIFAILDKEAFFSPQNTAQEHTRLISCSPASEAATSLQRACRAGGGRPEGQIMILIH